MQDQKVEFIIHSVAQLEDQAVPWLLQVLAGRRKIALYGDMGVGKTTLVKAFCQHLGVQENTSSPTFSLVNQYSYPGENGVPSLVHHLDLYRLRSAQEAYDIGLEDLLYDPWYCFIEWPQIVADLLPPEIVHLEIKALGLETRQLRLL